MRMIGDLVISRARLDDSLARVEAPRAAGRLARRAGEQPGDRAPAARPARRRDARAAGAGRRDLPAHAVRRPRPGARSRQAGPARAARAGHRDRQVPGRADDGSGAAPGAQRRQPRHRDAGRARRGRQAAPRARSRSRAASVGDRSSLEVADDGRGIDAAAVAARARALGFAVPDGPLDAQTLLDLLCAPGFSTRDEADRASGRGVGMEVVQDDGRRARRAR